jgi:hypothetical protein
MMQARSSPETLQERRQELSLLLGSMSLRAAFASYLAAQVGLLFACIF